MTREQTISFIEGAIAMAQYVWEQEYGLLDTSLRVEFSVKIRPDMPVVIGCSYLSAIQKALFQGNHFQPADEDKGEFDAIVKPLPKNYTMSDIDNIVNEILEEISKVKIKVYG